MAYNVFFNPILLAAAVLPAVFLLIRVYRADRVEKEPPRLLWQLLLCGMIAACFAMVLERLGLELISSLSRTNPGLYNVLLYFVVVACSEEGCKYVLLKRASWRHHAFNYQFDGVVYAVFVSLGFALFENISYVAMYGLGTALLRAVTAIPGHACFGVFMGAWYGFARRHTNAGQYQAAYLCRWLSFLVAAFLHGCYDYVASMETGNAAWLFVLFVTAMFVAALMRVRALARRDHYIG